MAGILDSYMFDPQSYGNGILGLLQSALKDYGLAPSANQPDQTPTGPTFASGSFGSMGGVPFSIGQPDTTTTLSAQPVQQQAPQAQMPQQVQQVPQASPDVLGNIAAGLRNFGSGAASGGLLPAVLDAVQGFSTGQRTDPAGMQQQAQQETYSALKGAGAPDAVARAAALNPSVFSAVAPRYLGENFKIVPYGGTAINNRGQVLFANDAGGNFTLDQPTLQAMAQQARMGDTTVFQNLGRGTQGAQNIVALRKEIARQNEAEGIGGAEQAAKNAEFFGAKAGQRSIGTRTANIELAANELKQVIPVVLDASRAVNRTNFPDINKVLLAAQEKTGDPNVVRFGQGINTLINLYARAINPSGIPTVYDKAQAHDILSKAWSNGQFEAAVGMMQKEVDAALASPALVKQQMRDRILGREPAAAPAAISAPAANAVAPQLPKIDEVRGGYRFRGGDPSDPNNWQKVN